MVALYVVDWFNPLIGHMQHSLRDPNRDHTHGRIWRITYPRRPLVDRPKIAGATVPELLELLKSYEDRTRYRARRELREHPAQEVLSALEKWVGSLETGHADYWRHVLEALWLHQSLDEVDVPLLEAAADLPRAPRPRRRDPRPVLLARPRARAARAAPQAGQRRASARAARGDPRPELLRGRPGRQGAGDRARVAGPPAG